ncbi:hypothetical protein RI367_005821 [Sorochytrium milnesiophthora]
MVRWFDVDVDIAGPLADATKNTLFAGNTLNYLTRWHTRFPLAAMPANSTGSVTSPMCLATVVVIDASASLAAGSVEEARPQTVQVVTIASASQADKLATVTALEWHPLRRMLIAGTSDGQLFAVGWQDDVGKGVHERGAPSVPSIKNLPPSHSAPISCLCFAATGRQALSDCRMLSADSDGTIVTWKANAKQTFSKLGEYRSNLPPRSVQFLPSLSAFGASARPPANGKVDTASPAQFLIATKTTLSICSEAGNATLLYTLASAAQGAQARGTVAHVLVQVQSLRGAAAGRTNGYLAAVLTETGLLVLLQVLDGGRIASTSQIKISGGHSPLAEGDSVSDKDDYFVSQWTACWVGDGLLAIGNKSQQTVRIIDLIGGDGDVTTLELPNTENGRINAMTFDKIRGRLAAGTDSGHLVIWNSRNVYQKGESRVKRVWQLLPRTSLGGSVETLLFHPFHSLLLSFKKTTAGIDRPASSSSCKVIAEQTELVTATKDYVAVQTNMSMVDIVDIRPRSAADDLARDTSQPSYSTSQTKSTMCFVSHKIKAGVSIVGLVAHTAGLTMWGNHRIETWQVDGQAAPSEQSSFSYQADLVAVEGNQVFLARENRIDVTSLGGVFACSIWLLDSEGEVIHIHPRSVSRRAEDGPSSSSPKKSPSKSASMAGTEERQVQLFVVTSSHTLSSYTVNGAQYSGSLAPKSLDSLIPGLMTVHSIAANVSGTLVAVVAQVDGSAESLFSLDAQSMVRYEQSSRLLFVYDVEGDKMLRWESSQPVSKILWDQKDERILIAEVEVDVQHTDAAEVAPQQAAQLYTFFVTSDHGVLEHSSIPCEGSLVLTNLPYLAFRGLRTDGQTVISISTAADFDGMEDRLDDANFVAGMLDFRFHLATGNIDEAFKMNNAVAAKVVRECSSDIEKLGMLAVQLGLYDDAVSLWKSNARWDLLSRLYQSQNLWNEAIGVAERHDRVNAHRVWHSYGRYLQKTEDFAAAASAYGHCGANSSETVKMLMHDEGELSLYIKGQGSKVAYLSTNNTMQHTDDVRHLIPEGHYAVAYEGQDKIKRAIACYGKAKCFTHAIRLAKQHQCFDDLMHLALQSAQSTMIDVARFFERSGKHLDKAIRLYHQGGNLRKALELATEHKDLETLQQIAESMVHSDNTAMLKQCADFLLGQDQNEQAIRMLTLAKEYTEARLRFVNHGLAADVCLARNVKIGEELADRLAPSSVAAEERAALLTYVADCCFAQGNYALACKKYTQAGDRVRAIQALLKSGETDKIIAFAGASGAKNREIYVLAANYLQSLDWRTDSSLMKHIISFYTKAKAFENLAFFFDACAQLEIDEYQNYEKALGALSEAFKCLTKVKGSSTDKDHKLASLQRRMELLSIFVQARKAVRGSSGSLTNAGGQEEALRLCAQLLGERDVNDCIRVGDIYSFLIETFCSSNQLQQAIEIYQRMLQAVPVKLIGYFLDAQVLALVDPNFEQRKRVAELVEQQEGSAQKGLLTAQPAGEDVVDHVEEDEELRHTTAF